jgi:Spy/CpxP family protein refolding chaperone
MLEMKMLRTLMLSLVFLVGLMMPPAVAQGGEGPPASASWRPMVYQLPGAYRFLDRLDLTEAQQAALAKIYSDWQTQRRELYAKVLSTVPALTDADRKDPAKVKKYYEQRREVYQNAQMPLPIALINDILSEAQLGKIAQAGKITDAWKTWLVEHIAAYEKKLEKVLGSPQPLEDQTRRQYHIFGNILDGAALLGRLKMTDQQVAKLNGLRMKYFSDVNSIVAPITQVLRDAEINPTVANELRKTVNEKARVQAAEELRSQLDAILTESQQEQLGEAQKIVAERDQAIWERYVQFLAALEEVLPSNSRKASPGR